jgi:hypothetical protein
VLGSDHAIPYTRANDARISATTNRGREFLRALPVLNGTADGQAPSYDERARHSDDSEESIEPSDGLHSKTFNDVRRLDSF